MPDENYYRNCSDAELEQTIHSYTHSSADFKFALREIHRRKEIKDEQVAKDQRQNKYFNIAILILAFLSLVVGAIQLLK